MATQQSEIQSVSDPKTKEVQRFVSIDFLRGASIFGMLVLHTVLKTLDVDHYTNQISNIALINIIALVALPYIGGLAGLFLMTSAVGNMIAQQRNLNKGHSIRSVLNKQITVGILVVFFAMLTEGVIGYNGALGELFQSLHDPANAKLNVALYRIFHFETIHTIGYAIILNGIVHALLVRRYDSRTETGKLIRAYWILSLVVLLITPIVWELTEILIPGYPDFAINPQTGEGIYMPLLGSTPWSEVLVLFLINPLSAPLEPILPYLATSFVGSIIGLQLSRPKEEFDRSFVSKYFKIGMFFFLVGFIGIVVLLSMAGDIDAILDIWRKVSWHRAYTSENGMPGGWIWQYLSLNGLALALVMAGIRLTEYRGNAAQFAKSSQFIRRFGFVAFSVYAMQYILYLVWYPVGNLFGYEPMVKVTWLPVWIIGIVSIFLLHRFLLFWEKRGYIGSIEWAISTIANSLVKVKRQASFNENMDDLKWYERGKLNVKQIFYDPKWKNFEIDEQTFLQDELRLVRKCNRYGFLVFPFSIVGFRILRTLSKKYPEQDFGKLKLVNYLSLAFFAIWFTLSLIFSLSSFGISL